jgi:outer membrane lipoprotein-sorting protein
MNRLILFFVSLFCWMNLPAQDARDLLRELNLKFKQVREYQADVLIRTDISFVKALPVQATVYFRQPDQFRIKSKGIAMLPRQGFDQVVRTLADTASYVPVLQGKETVDGRSLQLLSVLPLSDTADLILGKFWIDPAEQLIRRSQVTTRSNGTMTSDYFFGTQKKFALPDSMVFTVDTRKFKIPKAVAADLNNTKSAKNTDTKAREKGRIYLRFSNYKVNQGLPKEIFKSK